MEVLYVTIHKIASPLSRKATLVSVNISQWTARKLDRKVTERSHRAHGAPESAGRYNKLLIEAKRLEAINSAVSQRPASCITPTQSRGATKGCASCRTTCT